MTHRESIVDKIKKCLALSRSSNKHEAALALSRAKALMDKHAIKASEVDEEVGERKVIEVEFSEGMALRAWHMNLFNSVAYFHDCGVRRARQVGSRKYQVVIYGKVSNVTAAAYTVVALFNQTNNWATNFMDSYAARILMEPVERIRNSYKFGMAWRLCERLTAIKDAMMPKAPEAEFSRNHEEQTSNDFQDDVPEVDSPEIDDLGGSAGGEDSSDELAKDLVTADDVKKSRIFYVIPEPTSFKSGYHDGGRVLLNSFKPIAEPQKQVACLGASR